MLLLENLREQKDQVLAGLNKRNFAQAETLVEQALLFDQKRREAQIELDQVNAESNQLAKSIGDLMKQGKKEEAEKIKARSAELKTRSKELEQAMKDFTQQRWEVLVQIPNVPHSSVPAGKSAEDNITVAEGGKTPELGDWALPHWELIQKLDIIDFELGNKITGAGFPVYRGKGAKLQRALINFFLDEAEKAGYKEIQPPLLINRDSGFGTGQLPDKDGQMYHATEDDLFLIPTAEVPITNLYRDVILNEADFPIKNVGYTQCFRREAGSWGAHVRGLNRLHQFDKVEIVQIQHPSKSYETLEEMCKHVMGLLEKLELPYRRLQLCGGDMGFTSALTYDMEVFSGAQKRWLEVSSVSNFETYQANRLQCRFRAKDNPKNIQLVHTLNGSALALPRIVAALLENNQTQDGKVKIPAVLVPFTGFEWIE
jgi:seryl-tRNA synthetase